MSRPTRSPTVRLAMAYAVVFAWIGIYLPYWPVWLSSRGVSPTELGILLGLSPWTRLWINPLVGYWVDRRGRVGRFVQGLGIALVFALMIFFVADDFIGLGVAMVLTGIAFAPVVPLVDGVAIGEEASGTIHYGSVRLWGSVAFIGASGLGGLMLQHYGESIILWILIGTAVAMIGVSSNLPQGRRGPPITKVPSSGASGWTWSFAGFLLVMLVLHASHAMLYAFGTQHWRTHGLGEGLIGGLWALGVVAEIGVFAWAAPIGRRLQPHWLWLIAGVGGMIRWSLLGATFDPIALAGAQVLHAATFGSLHLGAMAYIRQRIPDYARARATTSYSAVASGLALGVAIPLAGVLYERFAGPAYWSMAGLSAIGTGMVFIRILAPHIARRRIRTIRV